MAGAIELKKDSVPKKKAPGVVILGAAAGVVLAGYLGLCAWVGSAGVMPNVTVAGLNVAGMDWDQVQTTVTQAVEEHGSKAKVTLTYGDWSGSITGDELDLFGEDSALNAWEVGRGSFLTQGFQYLRHLMGGSTQVELALGADGVTQQALESLLDEANAKVGGVTNQAVYQVVDDKLEMTKGVTGISVDREQARQQVYDAFQQQALPAAFRGEEAEVKIELAVTQQAPETPDFQAIRDQLCTQPQDARFDPETKQIVAHVAGVEFQAADLKAAYDAAAEGETFSIPVEVILPEETTQSLQSKLFANLLGEGTSRVGGSAARKHNVKLSAQACNNVILMPGEEFSYNNTTGSRSADKGYQAAPVYSGGASVDEVGGGICQTSSTIYYAVLHTTLEVVERSAHMYATGYVPDGMDATVYFGALDFRFKNNTNYPIKLVTESYDKDGRRYLTAKIFGTNEDGRYAIPERIQSDWIEPGVKYVADETIPRGTTKVDEKQNPYTGRSAQCYRYVYEKDGTLVEKQNMGLSKYKMRPETVYYNPLDGDPATWVDGKPPQPNVPAQPETPVQPEAPVQPGRPDQPQNPAPESQTPVTEPEQPQLQPTEPEHEAEQDEPEEIFLPSIKDELRPADETRGAAD